MKETNRCNKPPKLRLLAKQSIATTTKTTTKMTSSSLVMFMLLSSLVILLQLVHVVEGGIQEVDMVLVPTEEYVVYMASYIQGPGGIVDLTQLIFATVSDSYATQYQQGLENKNDGGNIRNLLWKEDNLQQQQQILQQQQHRYLLFPDFPEDPLAGTEGSPSAGPSSSGGDVPTTADPDNPDGTNSMTSIPPSPSITGNNPPGMPSAPSSEDGTTPAPSTVGGATPAPSTVGGATPPPSTVGGATQAPSTVDGATPAPSTEGSTINPATTGTVEPSINGTTDGAGPADEDTGDGNDGNGTGSFDSTEEMRKRRESYVDIVVFPLPSDCKQDPAVPNTCDYAELGVGKRLGYGSESELRWCCGEESISFHLCNVTDLGRLMVDHELFAGHHISLEVPIEGPMTTTFLSQDEGYIQDLDSSNYIIMYANCDPIHGREVEVVGESVISSKHGFLPGGMYTYMVLFTLFTVIYAVLFAWYGICMVIFRKQRIAIEQWIIFAIGLGLVEVLFRTADYRYWNNTGYRKRGLIWMGILFGIFKEGISRSLLVMVSLGWGIVTDRLGSLVMTLIISLGVSYIIITGVIDVLILVAIERYSQLSFMQENSLYNIVNALNKVQRVLDVLILLWIVIALFRTVSYLKREKQMRKLKRTQILLKIVLCSIFIALIWLLVQWIDKLQHKNEVVMMEHAWAKEAWMEANYLFVLVSIAILWIPNINAREYAYVIELGTSDYDHDDGVVTNDNVGTDLELTETNNRQKQQSRRRGFQNDSTNDGERSGITNGNSTNDEDDDDDDRSIT